MPEKILMIALSPTMETGTLARWRKKEGDTVASGDVLCEVETDKATMDYESTAEGTLLKILLPEGGQAKVGDPIAIVGKPGEDISALLAERPQPRGRAPAAKPAAAAPAATAARGRPPQRRALAAPRPTGRIKSSPLRAGCARRRASTFAPCAARARRARIVQARPGRVGRGRRRGPPRRRAGRAPVLQPGPGDEVSPSPACARSSPSGSPSPCSPRRTTTSPSLWAWTSSLRRAHG